LPEFGSPMRMHWASAFLIPCCEDFPDFFCLAKFDFSFLYLLIRFFRMFSEDLCFGTSFIITSRQAILSSSVVAFWNSCSAR